MEENELDNVNKEEEEEEYLEVSNNKIQEEEEVLEMDSNNNNDDDEVVDLTLDGLDINNEPSPSSQDELFLKITPPPELEYHHENSSSINMHEAIFDEEFQEEGLEAITEERSNDLISNSPPEHNVEEEEEEENFIIEEDTHNEIPIEKDFIEEDPFEDNIQVEIEQDESNDINDAFDEYEKMNNDVQIVNDLEIIDDDGNSNNQQVVQDTTTFEQEEVATEEVEINNVEQEEDRVDETVEDHEYDPPPPPFSPPIITDDEEEDYEESGTSTQRKSLLRVSSFLALKEMFEDIFYLVGKDREGTPIFCFLPRDARRIVTYNDLQEEQLIEFCLKMIAEVTLQTGSYSLIIAGGGASDELINTRDILCKIPILWNRVTRIPYRKNLKKLIILHPDPMSSAVLFLLRKSLSKKFWKKLAFISRVSDLDSILAKSSSGENVTLPIPDEILEYDISRVLLRGDNIRDRANSRSSLQQRQRIRAESNIVEPSIMSFQNYWQIGPSIGSPLGLIASKSPFGLPTIVTRCVTFLCYHGIKVPGLFRIPANADSVAYVKQRLHSNQDVDLGGYWSRSGRPTSLEDVHVCAAVLKSYFRELPKPIFTHAAYTSIMRAAATETDLIAFAQSIGEICNLLPKQNRALLQYLSYFLHYVIKYEGLNHMTASNLAICWVPNLFRDEVDLDDPAYELQMLPHAMKSTLVMFTHPQIVFPIIDSSILPPCFSTFTGEPLPLEEVLISDATIKNPTSLKEEDREYDIEESIRMSNMMDNGNLDKEETSTVKTPSSIQEIIQMSIKDLKRYLIMKGYDPSNCVEKNDLKKMGIECFQLDSSSSPQQQQQQQQKSLPQHRRGSSFEIGMRRSSLEMLGLKRNSDLDPRTRQHSTASSLTKRDASNNNNGETSSLDSGGGDEQQKSTFTQSTAAGFFNMLKRKSLLMRENKRDLTKSAKGIGRAFFQSSTTDEDQQIASAPKLSNLKSTSPTIASINSNESLEESARALIETPIFGHEDGNHETQTNLNESSSSLETQTWKIRDLDMYDSNELQELISSHGQSYANCNTETELRDKARKVLLQAVIDPFFVPNKRRDKM